MKSIWTPKIVMSICEIIIHGSLWIVCYIYCVFQDSVLLREYKSTLILSYVRLKQAIK